MYAGHTADLRRQLAGYRGSSVLQGVRILTGTTCKPDKTHYTWAELDALGEPLPHQRKCNCRYLGWLNDECYATEPESGRYQRQEAVTRRGWKPEWDWVERSVWTGAAIVWGFTLAAWLVGTILVGAGVPVGPAVAQIAFNIVPLLVIAHGLVYAGMWLRKKLLTGKDRDRLEP